MKMKIMKMADLILILCDICCIQNLINGHAGVNYKYKFADRVLIQKNSLHFHLIVLVACNFTFN